MNVKTQRQADADATKQKLIETALHLFATRGYANTSIDHVAAKAEVTKGAVYHHFKNKKEMLIACYRLQASWAALSINDAAEADDPWLKAMNEFRAFLDFVLDRSRKTLPLQEVITVLGWQEWRQIDTQYTMGNIIQTIESLQAANEMRSLQVNVIADMIYGQLVNASMTLISSDDKEKTLDELLDIIKGFFFSLKCSTESSTH